jgi:hypothetical protein
MQNKFVMARLLFCVFAMHVTAWAAEEGHIQGGGLSLGFHSCGGAAHVTDLSPMFLSTGKKTHMTGMTSQLDKPELFKPPYKGSFSVTVSLGKTTEHYQGQLENRKVLHLPNNYGSITWDGMLFHPIPKAKASIEFDLQLSATIPKDAANGYMKIAVTGASKEELICLSISVSGPHEEASQPQAKDDNNMLVV